MNRTLSTVLALCLGLFSAATHAQAPSTEPSDDSQASGEDAADEGEKGKPLPPASSVKVSISTEDLKKEKKEEADKERCAQLMAQGNSALAQAEGCGGGDQPIYAGSIVSFTQTTAPAYRTLPYNNNGFYGLSLYVAPRFVLTEKWALVSDVSLAYEVTQPDDAAGRQLWSTDTRLLFTGNLGTIGGITFIGGPRLVVPTSEMSWAAEVYSGVGAGLNAVKNFEILQGLAFSAGGSYVHTFSGRLTRKIREDNAPGCNGSFGGINSLTECSAGTARVVQDQLRAVGSGTLNFTPEWNLQASYMHGWNIVKPFADGADDFALTNGDGSTTGTATASDNVIADSRVRRMGSFSLALSYQPTSWFIATLQGSTSVCYDSPFGGQSAMGGCAGASGASDFWLTNPIANKFSNVGLQLTVPVDAFIEAVQKGSDEKRTARRKSANKI